MKWKEAYSTGITKIDEQHQTIFKIVDDFQIALDEGKGKTTYHILLNLLSNYCENHFCYEENCVQNNQCPVAEKNKREHLDLLNIVKKYQQLYQEKGYHKNDAFQLVCSVDEWFKAHICSIDIHLKKCAKKSSTY